MKNLFVYTLFLGIIFLSSCITTGNFEIAHTLPKGDYQLSVIPSIGIQPEISQENHIDSILFYSAKGAFNVGLADKIELGIQTDIIFTTTVILKFQLTGVDKDFAFSAGPIISITPLISVFANSFGESYSILDNGGLAFYSSYRKNSWTSFANAHTLVYYHNSIFYKDLHKNSSPFSYGINAGIIKALPNNISLGLQLSIEKLGNYIESSISLGVIYKFQHKEKYLQFNN